MNKVNEESEFKPITDWQKSLVTRVLELNKNIENLDGLLKQLSHAETKEIDEHGCLKIKVSMEKRVPCSNQIAEARYPDLDTPQKSVEYFGEKLYQELKNKPGYGPHVSVMVFIHDGLLTSVEFNKEEDAEILNKRPSVDLLISADLP